jgi:hypothetical protein
MQLYEVADFRLFLFVIGTSAFLSFIIIGIPLGIHSSINDTAFIVYNVAYCWYGFVLLRLSFEYSLPGLSARLYLSTFIASSGIAVCFYMIHFLGVFDMSLGVIRTVPPTLNTIFVLVAYLIHAVQQPSSIDSENGDTAIDRGGVVTTMSPMRNVFNVDARGSLSPPQDRINSQIMKVEVASTAYSSDDNLFADLSVDYFGLSVRCGDMDNVKVLGSWFHQWIRCMTVVMCISGTYLYCQWLALTFSSASGALGEVGIYLVFALSFSVLRPVARFIGYLIDRHKTGGPSVEVLMEMSISFFYFTFYRNLFVSVRSYLVFFAIKSIHVAMEMLNCSICFSQWYRQHLDRAFVAWQDFPLGKRALRIVAGCKSVDMFVQLQCIKTGMRLYLFLSSAITFMLFFTFLRYGYNRPYYCLYREISDKEYTMLMNITFMAVMIELAVYGYTDWVCRTSYGHGVLTTWQGLLHGKLGGSRRSLLIYMIWLLGHVTTDIYLSRLDVSSVGGIDCPDL